MTQASEQTPMLKQYFRIKSEYPDAILMFRLGDFYEMFFEDAVLASSLLDITLTSRNKNDENPVPLCGVPYHAIEPYIAKLLECGKKVAICDQVEDPKTAKGVVRREVTRVVTPGCITQGASLSAGNNNFLVSIVPNGGEMGIALSDISTGTLKAGELPSEIRLIEELSRIEPKEILLPEFAGQKEFTEKIKRVLPNVIFTKVEEENLNAAHIAAIDGGTKFGTTNPLAARAAGAIIFYLESLQKGEVKNITEIKSYDANVLMRLDESTKRNLELTRTMISGEKKGSLLELIDKTLTSGGARKLKQWLLYPLISSRDIEERLESVEIILSDTKFLDGLSPVLKRVSDLERIASRAALSLANARDLVALKESLFAVAELKNVLAGQKGLLRKCADVISPHSELCELIEKQVGDESPLSIKDGGIIKAGVSAELDELRNITAHGKDFVASLEAKEKQATGISSLKIRYNKVFGYYLEITNTHREKAPAHYIRKQTLANAERYITPELKEYEEKILGSEEKSKALEYEIFLKLRERVAGYVKSLLQTADAISQIDVLVSYAKVAHDYNYKKPQVDNGEVVEIKDGRHPIVERLNPIERFVPNDVFLDNGNNRLLMITGPNMAGKSTVMRQCALIVLLAQIGSFVPAGSARIGVCDRIFTRVGASDALSLGQSTFMVEMSEAALILKDATKKSLIIIDEIGRGTSTFDGLSIAWAVAEDLHDRVGARTMFATHYHELTELSLTKTGIKNMHIAVREWNGEVIFLRRLINGATSRSYGIQVAKLAGLPEGVIERAGEVLANLESQELDEVGQPRISHHKGEVGEHPAQLNLFTKPQSNEIIERISNVDIQTITPLEALNLLHELKKKI